MLAAFPSDADCDNIQDEIAIGMLEIQVTAASSEFVAEIVFSWIKQTFS